MVLAHSQVRSHPVPANIKCCSRQPGRATQGAYIRTSIWKIRYGSRPLRLPRSSIGVECAVRRLVNHRHPTVRESILQKAIDAASDRCSFHRNARDAATTRPRVRFRSGPEAETMAARTVAPTAFGQSQREHRMSDPLSHVAKSNRLAVHHALFLVSPPVFAYPATTTFQFCARWNVWEFFRACSRVL